MKTRAEVVRYLTQQLDPNGARPRPIPRKPMHNPEKSTWRYGRVELRHFLDWFYDDTPTDPDEELR